ETLPRLTAVEQHVDGVELLRTGSMPAKYLGGEITLQSRKTKPIFPVALQYELHRAVTKSADSVIEQNGIAMHLGHGLHGVLPRRRRVLQVATIFTATVPPTPAHARAPDLSPKDKSPAPVDRESSDKTPPQRISPSALR